MYVVLRKIFLWPKVVRASALSFADQVFEWMLPTRKINRTFLRRRTAIALWIVFDRLGRGDIPILNRKEGTFRLCLR